MSALDLDALAEDLCRIFVGWKLREDEPALRALGEGELGSGVVQTGGEKPSVMAQ